MQILKAIIAGLLVVNLQACGLHSEQPLQERAQRAAASFAEDTAQFIRSSSSSDRQTFVANFKALPITTFYDLLEAVVPRGEVAIRGKIVTDFAQLVAGNRAQIDSYGSRYKSVGDLIAKEGLKINLPQAAGTILNSFDDLYENLKQPKSVALGLLGYSRRQIRASEDSNECIGDKPTSDMPYECYGEYKVTEFRKDHVEEHLHPPKDRNKSLHTIFTNEAVISTMYRNLRDAITPVKGPIYDPEHNSNAIWFKIKNAGINGEQYVQVNVRPNKNMVTAYPVSHVP
ncbi:MAG: hypothetical protein FJ146_12245 [Deltaproteobacteria bacterium]|nr:hypothetical protein [Deltaproteobacteria bacterium]